MVQKISYKAVYRLIESFTLWDNHMKKGPWQLEYTKNEKIDWSKFTDAVGFSFKYLEDSNAGFNDGIRKIAPILYLIGPIYALKAISELEEDFYASGKAPKGVFKSNASVEEVVDRYTVPAIWLPFINSKAEENNNGIRFTSDIGPMIDFDWGKKECAFRFGGYEKLLFSEEEGDTENSLRLINLMLKSEGLSNSKYKYIKEILKKELEKAGSENPGSFYDQTLREVAEDVCGPKDWSDYVTLIQKKKINSLNILEGDTALDKNRFVSIVCGLMDTGPRYKDTKFFDSLMNPAAPHKTAEISSGFDLQIMFLIPRNYEEILLYTNIMRSGFDAIYPELCFPVLHHFINHNLDVIEKIQLDYYPSKIELRIEDFKNEVRKKVEQCEPGTFYLEVPKEFKEELSEITTLSCNVNEEREHKTPRILMSFFGKTESASLKNILNSQLNSPDFRVLLTPENRYVLRIKKVK